MSRKIVGAPQQLSEFAREKRNHLPGQNTFPKPLNQKAFLGHRAIRVESDFILVNVEWMIALSVMIKR
jgi:hypothetical protein